MPEAQASQRPRMESLLSSFPAPPSFIPPSPSPLTLAYDRSSRASSELEWANPPPTRPPTLPLPPLPQGAGAEVGLDALMLLCNTPSRRTSVASKRMSRMSDTNVALPGTRPPPMAPLQPPSSVSLPDDHPPEPRRRSALPPPMPTPSPPPPEPCETPQARRPASPDIPHILATTPRPLVRRMLPHALGDRRASTAASSSPSLIHSTASSQSSSDNDDDMLAPGEQSDSSIDTRTPLPHLMVKAGVLSPYSKILITPADDAQPSTSKPGSLLKDGRDTQRRKNRHRDGRLLREGVGLTTGLGWSDSEDEDAPSPLTHRLSTLDLSRRPSMLSVRSAYSRSRTPSRSPRASTFSTAPSSSTLSLSRTSSVASSLRPTASTSTASPSSSSRRQRTGGGSDSISLRSSASTSALSALAHQHSPPPVPELPSSPGMASMRRTVSHYPLRPPDNDSLLQEKPLPQPPMLERPPPRSTSKVRTRLSGPASAPPSAFYSTGGLPRPRTYSTGSNVSSTSSVGSTGTAAAKPRVKSVPVGSAAAGRVVRTVSTTSTASNISTSTAGSGISRRPAMKRQASMPLPPPSMPQRSSIPTSATSTIPMPSSGTSTIPMPTPGPSSMSVPTTPVSPGGGPRPLKLVASAAGGTALPVPRGRTGTVGRTGAGMAYRTSAAPRPRLSAPSAV